MEPGSNSRKAVAYGKKFSACTKCTNFCFANHQASNDPLLLHHRHHHAPSAGGGVGGGGGNDQMQLPAPSFIKLILDSNEDHRSRFLVSKKKKK